MLGLWNRKSSLLATSTDCSASTEPGSVASIKTRIEQMDSRADFIAGMATASKHNIGDNLDRLGDLLSSIDYNEASRKHVR